MSPHLLELALDFLRKGSIGVVITNGEHADSRIENTSRLCGALGGARAGLAGSQKEHRYVQTRKTQE